MRVVSGKARGTNLYTLEGDNTRPTLDRIKESLFNIIQNRLNQAIVLDLFAGSGALGIEAISRGAKKTVFCDKSPQAINIIKKNLEKTHFQENAIVLNKDYENCLNTLVEYKFDIIFLDPPYKKEFVKKAIEIILEKNLLSEDGIIVVETDEEEKQLKDIENININVYDLRKYGRVKLIFLNRKG